MCAAYPTTPLFSNKVRLLPVAHHGDAQVLVLTLDEGSGVRKVDDLFQFAHALQVNYRFGTYPMRRKTPPFRAGYKTQTAQQF